MIRDNDLIDRLFHKLNASLPFINFPFYFHNQFKGNFIAGSKSNDAETHVL